MNNEYQSIPAARDHRKSRTRMVWAAALLLGAGAVLAERPGVATEDGKQWIGTWATAAEPFLSKSLQTYQNQSLRLIVHTSAGGGQG